MDIEREWGKYPGWFGKLNHDQQSTLLAERRLRAKEIEQAQKQARQVRKR